MKVYTAIVKTNNKKACFSFKTEKLASHFLTVLVMEAKSKKEEPPEIETFASELYTTPDDIVNEYLELTKN